MNDDQIPPSAVIVVAVVIVLLVWALAIAIFEGH